MSRRRTADPRRIAAGVSLILGPLLLLAANVVSPAMRTSNVEQLRIVARQPDRQYVSALLALLAIGLLVPAVFGLRDLLRPTHPRLGLIGAWTAIVGLIATTCSLGLGLLEWQMVKGHLDRASMVALLDQLEGSRGMAVVFFAGVLVSVGLLLLAAGLAASRSAPRWMPALAAAGTVGVEVGFTINNLPVAIVASGAMVVGLAGLGRRVLTGPLDRAPGPPPSAELGVSRALAREPA